MLEVKGLKFADNIGVAFKLSEHFGCKTVQETFQKLEVSALDDMLEILTVAYNDANNSSIDSKELVKILGEHEIGFIKIGLLYRQFVEKLSFDGLTAEEKESISKNVEASLKK